ncbi:glycosyltransferase family 2 protein, partial [Candidatus Woesearchaeota archaeon]|nr:glycosyltransferase family 2 protein [Candidatus Woesearchaeota archaeon]
YDIVIGSRGLKESQVQKRPFKIFMSKCFSLLKWMILGLKFQDTQCGFKLFKRKTLSIFEKQTIKSSCFDVELLYIAQKQGFSIKEKAVTWMDSDLSNFQTWKIVPEFLRDMTKIRKQSWQGYYK